MVDRVVTAGKNARRDAWAAFKTGLQIKGYRYYEPPAQIKYRYPAPGSCPLDVTDHPNLYKNDWKVPFRNSDYNIQKVEWSYDDDDLRQAENYVSKAITYNPNDKLAGKYDQAILNQAVPELQDNQAVLFGEMDSVNDESKRNELWECFDNQQAAMEFIREDYAPGQHDYDDDYNQVQLVWQNRGVTGFENNARLKEMFVELEYWIEEVIGAPTIKKGKIKTYKGEPKKWQILDDAVFDRDQIAKLQAAADAPAPEQLEQWREKHHGTFISAPYNNANVSKWRDDTRALDSADFDPKLLGHDREQKRRLFLERYEKPKELTQGQ